VKARILLGLLFGLFIAPSAFAVRTILYYENECCRNITEGEFAILYAQGLKLREPAQGWTVQSASAALSTLGHQPQGGWVLSRFLSEAVMARLLRNSPFYRQPFNTEPFQQSSTLVTIARGRGVFPEDSAITQGEFALLAAKALELKAPPTGWNIPSAIEALSSRRPAIRPAQGWKADSALRELEMLQILANTLFRTTSIDTKREVTPLQAYSLLFGKFEIATEGDFAVFVAQAVRAAEPPGGWTRVKAIDYLVKEFGLKDRYGWSSAAPLCAEKFESALKQVINQVNKSVPNARDFPSDRPQGLPASELAMQAAQGGPNAGNPLANEYLLKFFFAASASQQTQADTESFLKEVRRKGLMSGDRCATISLQGLQLIRGQVFDKLAAPLPDVSGSTPPPEI
jgi:hypothetical protein